MLQYLIIQLCDTSTSFCHYTNDKTKAKLISLSNLKLGIKFAMKQNLMILCYGIKIMNHIKHDRKYIKV